MDRNHALRFDFEISLNDALPLYFFDADGNRAGMVWFVHRMTDKNAGYDAEEAMRQAGELGLVEGSYKAAAQAYIDGLKKSPVPAAAAVMTKEARAETPAPSAPAQAATADPAPAAPAVAPDQTTIPAVPDSIALPLPDAASLDLAATGRSGRGAAPREVAAARDPTAWRPYIALVLAALGVPVAYCGRSIIQFRGLVRASLPKPARRVRSLPAVSGE
jgi:hypothetical protein